MNSYVWSYGGWVLGRDHVSFVGMHRNQIMSKDSKYQDDLDLPGCYSSSGPSLYEGGGRLKRSYPAYSYLTGTRGSVPSPSFPQACCPSLPCLLRCIRRAKMLRTLLARSRAPSSLFLDTRRTLLTKAFAVGPTEVWIGAYGRLDCHG
jgi:hypothetical protein